MARIKVEMAGGPIGNIEAALTDAGFTITEAEDIARRLLNTTHGTFRTDRFRRRGIDAASLVASLRAAGLRVQYTGVQPPAAPAPSASAPG